MPDIIGLFPIPFMRAPKILAATLVSGLVDHFSRSVEHANSSSPNLSHTALLKPADSPLLVEAAAALSSGHVHEMTDRLDELARATQGYATAMRQVAAASEEQSASTQEIAAAAAALGATAQRLADLAATFHLDAGAPPPHRASPAAAPVVRPFSVAIG